jgi:hypothetical protein
MPEALLRLAEWWRNRGHLGWMTACATLARAASEAPAAAPQPIGIDSWVIPAHLAALLADVDPRRAAEYAQAALRAAPPPEVCEPLVAIVGRDPAGPPADASPVHRVAAHGENPWPT